MAMKEQPRSIYRSMQGKELDMNKLINQNEMTVAVGNVKVNARGDELGPGGKIIKKREDVLRETQGAVPSQLSSRAGESVVEELPQVQSVPVQRSSRVDKNISDMDPEGNE